MQIVWDTELSPKGKICLHVREFENLWTVSPRKWKLITPTTFSE